MTNYKKQVDKNHYSFKSYYYPGRWMSYWHEIDEILSHPDIESVLDIGPGSNLLRNILKTFNPDLTYETLDVAPDVEPDHVGSATSIPLSDNTFDAVCAFQVLEHIEFKDVEQALQELKRVSRKYIIISLPHYGPQFTFSLKLPFVTKLQFAFKFPWLNELEFKGQHYWEIGRKGYPLSRIEKMLSKHFEIENQYIPFQNQYHHFFVLKNVCSTKESMIQSTQTGL